MGKKFSNAQRGLLHEAAIGYGAHCVKAYRTAQTLVKLGFAAWERDDEYSGDLVATPAGRQALAEAERADG